MSTKNPRLNITIEPSLIELMSSIAHQESKSLSRVAKELLIEALDRREDLLLSHLAEERDSEDLETISHEDAWK